MKVVIVDDDQLVALSLKTILEADARVTVVATGTDGTDAAKGAPGCSSDGYPDEVSERA